jgi:hypothetical protein
MTSNNKTKVFYFKKALLIVGVFLVVFVFISKSVFASSVTFKAPASVGPGTPFVVDVDFSASGSINALNLIVNIPKEFKVVDISDGNSIVSIWIERPHVNDKNQIVASGIIPGGFIGKDAKLLRLSLLSEKLGQSLISLDPVSISYKSSADGVSEVVTSKPFALNVIKGVKNTSTDVLDNESPESFLPVLSKLPTDADGKWNVVFTTQDKNSGIDHYEVAESGKRVDISDKNKVNSTFWKVVTSPFELNDQSLQSYVFVKAVDKKSNYRIEVINPTNKRWYEYSLGYIIVVLVFVILLYALSRKKTKVSRRL